jgi:FkbM family methyltransferase
MGAIHFSLDPNLVHALRTTLPLESFVETGTFQGDTANAMAAHFSNVHTVELSEPLYAKAVDRLAPLKNVTVIHGSSPDALRDLSKTLAAKSTLYWLDAHWCGGGETSGRHTNECPLLAEIAAIRSLNDRSVVLIDDARYFIAPPPPPNTWESWPLIEEVISALRGLSDRHKIWIINDVIIFAPKACEPDVVRYSHTFGVDLYALFLAATRSAPAKAAPQVESSKPPASGSNDAVSSEDRPERLFALHLERLGIRQVLDIGANTGQFAGTLRRHGYGGVIHSVEPQATAYAGLLANAANDVRWLPAPRQGVGDVEGPTHLRAARQAQSLAQEMVFVTRASNLFRAEVMRSIEAIRLDVQGDEKRVLDGLAPHLGHMRLLMLAMSFEERHAGETNLFMLDRFLTEECGFSRISLEPARYDDQAGVVRQYDGLYFRPEAPPSAVAGGVLGVAVGAVVTSIGGSERRLNERGADLGPEWHRACRQASRALTQTVISVSESPPPDEEITWVQSAGKPAVVELLRAGVERTSGHLLIANADILFNQPFRNLLGELSRDAVYYGRRHDVRENAAGVGPLRVGQPYVWGFDYFLMPGEFARAVVSEALLPSEFRIGEPWWDYLMPVLGHALGFPVKRIGPQRALALHYVHEQRFTQQVWLENGNRFLACLRDLQQRGAPFAQGLLAELLADPADPPDLQRLANLICHRLA